MRLRPYFRRFKTDVLSWSRFTVATLVCTATVAAGAYGAYAAVWPALAGHAYFRLRSVKVMCNSQAATPGVLASRAGLYEGTSLWEVDTSGAERALAAAPWVRSATVARRFPSHVSLRVDRREPIAATFAGDGPYLIDAAGIVYREEEDVPFVDLPYLTGWQQAATRAERIARLHRCLAIARAAAELGVAVSEIYADEQGTYWLYPENRRISVRLGAVTDARLTASRLRAVLSTLPEPASDIREVDLSYPDRAVLRTARGRARQVASILASRRRSTSRQEANERG
jgi:cell division protein FtsQ